MSLRTVPDTLRTGKETSRSNCQTRSIRCNYCCARAIIRDLSTMNSVVRHGSIGRRKPYSPQMSQSEKQSLRGDYPTSDWIVGVVTTFLSKASKSRSLQNWRGRDGRRGYWGNHHVANERWAFLIFGFELNFVGQRGRIFLWRLALAHHNTLGQQTSL